MQKSGSIAGPTGVDIAWLSDGPDGCENGRPGFFWLGGFMSDMAGTKAQSLARFANSENRNCLRFDYTGHGRSGGTFRDGTISKWLSEAAFAFTSLAPGPRIIVGSSMGGWLAILLARKLREELPEHATRIAGMILIAPAADMTQQLLWQGFDDSIRQDILDKGIHEAPSEYSDEPYIITRELIDDGKKHLILNERFGVHCPVRILHGEDDPDVPWQHGLRLYDILHGDDIAFTLVKSGDHRLSTERDLTTLFQTCRDLCKRADASD